MPQAVCPGSFDPVTNGHLDVFVRAADLIEKVTVAFLINKTNSSPVTVDERIEMLRYCTKDYANIEITSFQGLTAEFARQRNATTLVRGLRVVSDFEYEITMAIANQKLNPVIDTVCLMPSEKFLLLSSRIVREIAIFGGDLTEFVPPEIQRRIKEKLGKK